MAKIFRIIYQGLLLTRKIDYNKEKNESTCIELITLTIENLIYGDKNDPHIFE